MVAQSALLTIFVLAGNTLLRPLVNAIDRIPLNEHTSEATYEVIVTTDAVGAPGLREQVVDKLNAANYPVRETTVFHRPPDIVEIVAVLVSSAVEPEELEAVIGDIGRLPGVAHVTWEVSTID
jgi:putative Mg2+ transporter-C (MgtC) family protein